MLPEQHFERLLRRFPILVRYPLTGLLQRSPQSAVAGRSLRVKPDHLCRGGCGCAAPLVAHQQNYDHTSERRRAKNPT